MKPTPVAVATNQIHHHMKEKIPCKANGSKQIHSTERAEHPVKCLDSQPALVQSKQLHARPPSASQSDSTDSKVDLQSGGLQGAADPLVDDPHRIAMKGAQEKLKGILLPPTFGGFSLSFEAALPRFERPRNNCWFRVSPDACFDVLTFKGQDGSLYVALPGAAELIAFLASRNAGRPTRCYPYLYNDAMLGFWPVPLDGVNGRQLDDWNKSAHIIAEESKKAWRAIVPGKDCYRTASAPAGHLYGEPVFPSDLAEQFSRIIQGVIVEDLNHPEMKRWQGLQ